MPEPYAYLVETIPADLTDLPWIDGVQPTAVVLKKLVDHAQQRIDIAAMYWSLCPNPQSLDEMGLTHDELLELGADKGQALYESLQKAAQRGVPIHILQSPGIEGGATPQEAWQLAHEYPQQVTIIPIDLSDWYDSGIMHMKVWLIDGKDMYIGSANNDWRALAQVREMGIVIENDPQLGHDLEQYLAGWRQLATMATPQTMMAYDPMPRQSRRVPAWSNLIPAEQRQQHPLIPLMSHDDTFISGSPPEFCQLGRRHDEEAILHTIHTAQTTIDLSVMDFVPTSLYWQRPLPPADENPRPPIWWPTLFNALLEAVITRGVNVRLLISQWAHTRSVIQPYLRAFRDMAQAQWADEWANNSGGGDGRLQIKRFIIPGWDKTIGHNRQYPGHSRVNHAKFIVTDQRLNIGTSNFSWDYFNTAGGCSFNTTHPQLRHTLQTIFNRDWESPYVHPLV